jgi:DNA polymerase-3 subunit chi
VTQIDFYILDSSAAGDRYLLTCRIADKARAAGHRIVVHSDVEEERRHLDRLLWTYRDASFIPHGVIGRDDAGLNPILIGDGAVAVDEHDVLINLGRDVPTFFGRFRRMIECIDHDPEIKQAGRGRFRYYKEHGYPLNTHTIR